MCRLSEILFNTSAICCSISEGGGGGVCVQGWIREVGVVSEWRKLGVYNIEPTSDQASLYTLKFSPKRQKYDSCANSG